MAIEILNFNRDTPLNRLCVPIFFEHFLEKLQKTPENTLEKLQKMHKFALEPDYGIRKAYVLCNDNLHKTGNVEYIPVYMIYMIMFIQKNRDTEDLIYKVDLSGL